MNLTINSSNLPGKSISVGAPPSFSMQQSVIPNSTPGYSSFICPPIGQSSIPIVIHDKGLFPNGQPDTSSERIAYVAGKVIRGIYDRLSALIPHPMMAEAAKVTAPVIQYHDNIINAFGYSTFSNELPTSAKQELTHLVKSMAKEYRICFIGELHETDNADAFRKHLKNLAQKEGYTFLTELDLDPPEVTFMRYLHFNFVNSQFLPNAGAKRLSDLQKRDDLFIKSINFLPGTWNIFLKLKDAPNYSEYQTLFTRLKGIYDKKMGEQQTFQQMMTLYQDKSFIKERMAMLKDLFDIHRKNKLFLGKDKISKKISDLFEKYCKGSSSHDLNARFETEFAEQFRNMLFAKQLAEKISQNPDKFYIFTTGAAHTKKDSLVEEVSKLVEVKRAPSIHHTEL